MLKSIMLNPKSYVPIHKSWRSDKLVKFFLLEIQYVYLYATILTIYICYNEFLT